MDEARRSIAAPDGDGGFRRVHRFVAERAELRRAVGIAMLRVTQRVISRGLSDDNAKCALGHTARVHRRVWLACAMP